jgi:twitching motility protein PilT
MSVEQLNHLEKVGELDFAFSVAGFSRIRANVFKQRGTYAAALRILSYEVPTPESLGIPKSVVDLTMKKRGLVLVTGATGSGKSTTLASLIEVIANRDRKNIITLEDPIEYLHSNKRAIVSQREIGCDTQSYANALRAALRQDPDVILVGEMRDLETISTAITAAETGHLVFSTLHTNSSADAIDRMIDVFPPHQQQQIRIQLAGVLEGVIAQQLMPRSDTNGRIAAFEVLLANSAVRNLIREGKSFQIPSIIQTSKKEGMQTMDDCITNIFFRNQISSQTAITYALDTEAMRNKIDIM